MLDEEMRYFLEYCRISDFSKKSIESLSIRLNEFNEFLKTTTVTSLIDISYQHLRRFIGDFKSPSVHIKKARVWSLRQFFHFFKLNGWVGENIALDFPVAFIEGFEHRFDLFPFGRLCRGTAIDKIRKA